MIHSSGWLVERTSTVRALQIAGVVGLVIALALGRSLARVERSSGAVDPAMVSRLRLVPFFAPLPLPTLERLVGSLDRRELAPGSALIIEGESGDEFFVLLSGITEVTLDGTTLRIAEAPDFFGEIALLRDTPRMASVHATTRVEVGVIGRAAFLDAVARTMTSRLAADSVVRARA